MVQVNFTLYASSSGKVSRQKARFLNLAGIPHQQRAIRGKRVMDLKAPPDSGLESNASHPLPVIVARDKKTYLICKRIFDVVFALLALPVIVLPGIVIAILIYIESPGPVFFVQKRTGKHGKRFDMYKFRTMVRSAEKLKTKLEDLNELTWPDFKMADDPRVTRVGRILRKTSLDELPQVVNILKGDMSWVGPRPTSFGPETYKPWHLARLEATPGLTGLWQVSGRSTIDFDKRAALDIEYINRQSMGFDVLIIAKTITAVIRGDGAC